MLTRRIASRYDSRLSPGGASKGKSLSSEKPGSPWKMRSAAPFNVKLTARTNESQPTSVPDAFRVPNSPSNIGLIRQVYTLHNVV